MNPGRLRHRIKIQQVSESDNRIGGITQTWSDLTTIWSSIEPLNGREYKEAEQVQNSVSARIRIRYRNDITPGMRALYGTRIYDILAVINIDEINRELHLICNEVV